MKIITEKIDTIGIASADSTLPYIDDKIIIGDGGLVRYLEIGTDWTRYDNAVEVLKGGTIQMLQFYSNTRPCHIKEGGFVKSAFICGAFESYENSHIEFCKIESAELSLPEDETWCLIDGCVETLVVDSFGKVFIGKHAHILNLILMPCAKVDINPEAQITHKITQWN